MIRLYVQQIPGANGENVTVSHSRSQAKGISPRKARQKKRDDSSPKLHIIRLPVELRGVVFRQDLLEWTEGRLTPNLIKALQPNLRLYNPALDLFYSLKAYPISPRNLRELLSVPQSILPRVLSADLPQVSRVCPLVHHLLNYK